MTTTALLVLTLLSGCILVESQPPQISWMDCPERYQNYDECMKIVFSPRRWDVVILNKVDDFDTIFEGRLSKEPLSAVTVSGGNSSMKTGFLDITLSLEDEGFEMMRCNVQTNECTDEETPTNVAKMDEILSEHAFEGQRLDLNVSDIQERALDPRGYLYDVVIGIDDTFVQRFGSSVVAKITTLISHTNTLFKRPSLPTKINIKRKAIKYHRGQRWEASPAYLRHVANSFSRYESIDASGYVFLCYDHKPTGTIGYAYIGTVCSRYKAARTSLVEYFRNDLAAAKNMAHEIAHNLGVNHDFRIVGGNRRARYSRAGKLCTNVRGLMDYVPNPMDWTDCTKDDLKDYHARAVAQNGRFCLTPMDGPSPQPCVDKYSFCIYFRKSCYFHFFRTNCRKSCMLCS